MVRDVEVVVKTCEELLRFKTLGLKVETWDRYWTGLFTASAEAPHCWGCPRTFSDESSP